MSIAANELRIGDKVLYDDNIDEVYAIHFWDSQMQPYRLLLQNQRGKMGVALSEIQPIPLTPEILEKCGFEKINSTYKEAETYDYYLRPLYFDMANMSVKINSVYQDIKFPEFLHQLQNLYFALTEEELTINLK